MGQVPGKVRRKGAIRNDSKVQGLRNKKGGAAAEEMGSREQVRKRLGVTTCFGPWPLDVGLWSSGRSQGRR